MSLDRLEDIEQIPTVRDIKELVQALKGQPAGTAVQLRGFALTYGFITRALQENGFVADIESQSHIVLQKERDKNHPKDIEYTFTVTLLQDSSL